MTSARFSFYCVLMGILVLYLMGYCLILCICILSMLLMTRLGSRKGEAMVGLYTEHLLCGCGPL
jgi:hypothetical protein